ncbi:hypothetical protein WPS_19390 [Vulcanimicrobium alpinum]|uniref:Uncharacterized protein n=1 Tax=Vulcanimicrobium alpinum TaxID=3016050 RepID=A0AAN1XWG4_UNVUL|nr:SDR family NAD(P)-dependent oxidoreductase [Vulcanimicrobium alpinum]BDE06663.1 hypothetical protein WPS_19390 [Vulcanimicrobium alpinum]
MGARDEQSALSAPGTLVVTGGGRGIGSAITRCAAERGWAVAVNYLRDRESAEAVVNDIVARGGSAVAIGADIGDPLAAARLVAQAQEALGPIAGLVNNAAITGGIARVADVDAATLARVFAVNVIGAMVCARKAVRRMSKANGGFGGAIVNISSRAAVYGSAGEWVHYAASKAAIDAFTVGLAVETTRLVYGPRPNVRRGSRS